MKNCRMLQNSIHNQPVINSNTSHFCSPKRFISSCINRINPDKSTFLKSNLIVSNILNHLSPIRSPEPQDIDAYTQKDIELCKKIEEDLEYQQKMHKVQEKAKSRMRQTQLQIEMQEKQLIKQAEQIQIMRIEMDQKARDIMGRKEDTAYLGRNLFLQGDKFLKQMKDSYPSEKILKTEATRMLMKECSKKKGSHAARIASNNNEEVSEIISPNNTTLNASMDGSVDPHWKKENKTFAAEREKKLIRSIKNKSFDVVMKEQKRNAAWEGFSTNWAMGFCKNEGIISTKKRRRNKKSPQKYINACQSSTNLLEYNDQLSRHRSLKQFKESFNSTAETYALILTHQA